MPAYVRGELGVEAYLVRILTAIVRANGGEFRVKGELIDTPTEPTALIKEWDARTQELVLRAGNGSFVEVYRVTPEKQQAKTPEPRIVDPLENLFTPKREAEDPRALRTSTVDNPNLADLERRRAVRQAAALLRDELRRRHESRGEVQ
jgi:hypothetical protein